MPNKNQRLNRKILARAAKIAGGDKFPKHSAAKPWKHGNEGWLARTNTMEFNKIMRK